MHGSRENGQSRHAWVVNALFLEVLQLLRVGLVHLGVSIQRLNCPRFDNQSLRESYSERLTGTDGVRVLDILLIAASIISKSDRPSNHISGRAFPP